jgi:hypothetical protein
MALLSDSSQRADIVARGVGGLAKKRRRGLREPAFMVRRAQGNEEVA